MGFRFVEWGPFQRELQVGKATGKMTSSSFKGVVHGKKIEAYDIDTKIPLKGGMPSGIWLSNALRELGAGRRPWNARNEGLVDCPYYAQSTTLSYGVYVDLVHAYPQLYKHLCWDLEFTPDTLTFSPGHKSLQGIANELWDFKHARNALVGFALSRHRTYWNEGKPELRRYKSGFHNRHLPHFLWAVLSFVAHNAIRLGAVYYNTDGAIFPAEKLWAFNDWCDGEGLQVDVKYSGPCIVWGTGAYSFVGDHSFPLQPSLGRVGTHSNLTTYPVSSFAYSAWDGERRCNV